MLNVEAKTLLIAFCTSSLKVAWSRPSNWRKMRIVGLATFSFSWATWEGTDGEAVGTKVKTSDGEAVALATDGKAVGAELISRVEGLLEGSSVGLEIVGMAEGTIEGKSVGIEVVGMAEGMIEGK
jgi:hypothetical protein